MASVQFSERDRYDLAASIAAPLGCALDPDTLSVETSNAVLAALLDRVARGAATVLPRRGGDNDEWLIVGATRRERDMVLLGAGRFVVPTYAEHDGGALAPQLFDQGSDALERLIAQVYGREHYRWRSPSAHFTRILQRLGRWADLDVRRPQTREERSPSYRDLLERFNAALSGGAWDDAEACLDDMRRSGLISADNLVFLEVQLLAQQRRWNDLWRRPDFPDIARLRAPRPARAALLTAFHQGVLLDFEQQGRWIDALEAFRRARPRSGALLEGRADISYGPAARVFAYRAVADADRSTIDALLDLPVDEETRQVVAALAGLLPAPTRPPEPPPPTPSPQQAIRLAIADGAFDLAVAAVAMIEDPAERALAMIEVAFLSDDTQVAEDAMLQFWDLPAETQAALQRAQRVARMVALLSDIVAPPPPPEVEDLPRDWLDWLGMAKANPDDTRLARSLDTVSAADDRYWTEERLTALSDLLTDLAASDSAHRRSHIREAVRHLRNYFLQDPEFPRARAPYDDIYEALYLATFEQREVNEPTSMTLLRLAEARLRRSPAARDTIAHDLMAWLDDPFPALEGVAQEALDLLAAYGVQGPTLAIWYRAWAEALLAVPRVRDRASLEGWIDLGTWVQPGDDLLERLRSRLPDIADGDLDPVAALPAGYQIAIFTLRPVSAERAGDLLRRRNAALDVRVCDDTVLTDRARALAQGSQITVVVTTCITHALTYGIGPYLRDPVYPQSSGATSILRAIEGRLRAA